jgi:integrase
VNVARLTNRLKAVEIKGLKAEGLYADGGGLYLRCTSSGSQSWIYRYRAGGKLRDMGLGPIASVPLAKARQLAAECARQRLSGIDPIQERNAQRVAAQRAEARGATFKACAEELIASRESGWSNAKHHQQWMHSLRDYVYPLIGDIPVSAIDTDMVLTVLQQPATGDGAKASTLWAARTETASRIRSRIEAVLSYAAKVKKAREGENPAQWRGHLDQYLPPRAKVRSVKHQPALPYAEIPAFMATLRARESTTARALEFTILCAARMGEVLGNSMLNETNPAKLGVRFGEIDLKERIWTVPAARMKTGKPHRVPLSARAVAIVHEMAACGQGDLLFPGVVTGRPIGGTTVREMLCELRPGVTTHGFRSTFRTWAGAQTGVAREVAEMALAHKVGDAVERAYWRDDLLDKRRSLMEAWAQYCARVPAGVVPFQRASAQ